MEVWDPHFHLWDVTENTQSGHDSSQLFAPDDNPVYSLDLYKQDMLSAGSGFEHSGGAFVEAESRVMNLLLHVWLKQDGFPNN